MSEENIEFIKTLFEKDDQMRTAQIKGIHKTIDAGFDVFNMELQHIKEDIHKIVLMGNRQTAEIEKIKKETFVWRLIHKHPKVSLFFGVILIFGVIGLLSYLNKAQVESIVKSLIRV